MDELDVIKSEVIAVAEALIKGDVKKSEAEARLGGVTALLCAKSKAAISEAFEYIICPNELFERAMAELTARKKKYTAIEARGCVLNTFADNPQMTEENRKTFIAAVLKNVLPEEMERF